MYFLRSLSCKHTRVFPPLCLFMLFLHPGVPNSPWTCPVLSRPRLSSTFGNALTALDPYRFCIACHLLPYIMTYFVHLHVPHFASVLFSSTGRDPSFRGFPALFLSNPLHSAWMPGLRSVGSLRSSVSRFKAFSTEERTQAN